MKFNELGLKKSILSAIQDLGYETPTPIQAQAIPYLLEKEGDLIGLASTGTGKTASFGLPLIHQVDDQSKNTQGLIICPTRELCIQISRDLDEYAKNIPKLKVVPVYGGTDIVKQIKQIERGAQIIVATPGRLLDLINRKKVKLWEVQTVILDEADEMLNMGFKEDIDSILDQTPEFKSVWLFSATMPKEVAQIAKNYMVDPHEITVGGKNETNKNIEHHYYVVKERDRFDALKSIIDFNPDIYGLIFCRTRRDTGNVADQLLSAGYNAEPLHGDLSQAQRDRVMKKFRDKTLQILVATDVAARGIDVNDITHVIHYQLPEDVENYTHRSGRTARAGKKGVSIALINTRGGRKINSIEKIIKTRFELKTVPSSDDICETQLSHSVNAILDENQDLSRIKKFAPMLLEKLDHLSKEELIQRFLAVEFNKFLSYYDKARDLNAKASDRGGSDRDRDRDRGRGGKSKYKSDPNAQRFFVGLGKKDGFNSGALLRLICDNAGIAKKDIGQIDILEKFSFFDANPKITSQILDGMQDANFDGKSFNIEKTKGGGDSGNRSANRSGNRSGNRSSNRSSNRFGGNRRPDGPSKRRSQKGNRRTN